MIKVMIPMSLKKYTDNVSTLEIEPVENVDALLSVLTIKYPQLKTKIFSNTGTLHPFINAFVNGKNIRQLEGGNTALETESEVNLVAAIAGG